MSDRSWIRAFNAVISAAMMALFLVHGVGNAFQMIGVGSPLSKVLSWVLVALCVVHAALGVVLTLDTRRTQREAGVSYVLQNKRFWIVRVSGFALALLIAFHAISFLHVSQDPVRLAPFGVVELIGNILLVVALAVHVLANMAPFLVGLGVPLPRARALDISLGIALLLVLMIAAFVVYYLRWVAI